MTGSSAPCSKYRVLPKITGFFGIISALFKKLWDQAEMHETLETYDNFEIVASTIKAIYNQTCKSRGLINRLIIYMPKDGEQVRKMRIDHRVGDTPAKQKLLRPDKRQSEDQGPVSDKRQTEAVCNFLPHPRTTALSRCAKKASRTVLLPSCAADCQSAPSL